MALSHRSLDEVVAHKTCRVAVTSRWSNESNGENIVSLHYVRFNRRVIENVQIKTSY